MKVDITEFRVSCYIGSQRGRVPMQVRIGRPGSEGGVGGAEPS